MRFVSSVSASKYSEGDLGVLLSLVSSTSSACSFGVSRSGMWCYQIKGLPPPRHHQKSRNISIADAADLVRDLTAWGSSSGCCPALESQGRGSSHAPARADILFGISRGSRMIRRLRRRACVRRRRPAASSGTTWTNRLVLRPRCKYAQRRRY